MPRFVFILLISSLLHIILTLGIQRDKNRDHWLRVSKSSPDDLTNEEKEKLNHLDSTWKMLDGDGDDALSLEEIKDKAHYLSLAVNSKDPGLGYEELKYLFCGSDSLMEPSVFEDMWWIMTHNLQPDIRDYSEIFFKYTDSDGNGLLANSEIQSLLITGGRTKQSPTQKTEYHELFVTLDQDQSGGLTYLEMWGPIVLLLKSQPSEGMSTGTFAEVVQGYSKLSPSLLDCKGLALCLDSDGDEIVTLQDNPINFVSILDKNYNDLVDEFEMKIISEELERCSAKFVEDKEEKKKDEL